LALKGVVGGVIRTRTIPIEDILAARPLDSGAQARADALAAEMVAQVRADRLAELRKERALTQQQVAARLSVSQHRVSQIEHGGLASVQVDTLRRYVEALWRHADSACGLR